MDVDDHWKESLDHYERTVQVFRVFALQIGHGGGAGRHEDPPGVGDFGVVVVG